MTNSAVDNPKSASGTVNLIYACFFVSGFNALVYEISWQRLLLRILGSTLPSVTIVLCIIMAGLGIGALLVNRVARRCSNPLLLYGLLELFVGVFGVFSITVFDSQPGSIVGNFDAVATNLFSLQNVDSFEPFNAIFWCRTLFVALCLLLPTTLMGATFPMVSEFLSRSLAVKSAQTNAYCSNLVGAACGTLAAGFLLLPQLGLANTILVASGLSAIVGVVCGILGSRSGLQKLVNTDFSADSKAASSADSDAGAADENFKNSMLVLPLVLVAINSAIGMSLEVVWSRLFALIVGSSTYAVASVFAVTIVGLALGTGVFQKLCSTREHHMRWLATACFGIGASLLVNLAVIIQNLPWIFNVQHSLLSQADSYNAYLCERISVIASVVLLPSFFCGGIFPIALQLLSKKQSNSRWLPGAYAISSFGSVAGAALTGFVFIPLFGRIFSSGMESTLVLLAAIEFVLAAILVFKSGKKLLSLASVPLLFILFFARPPWNQSLISSGIPFLSMPTKAATTKAIFDRALSDSPNNKLLFYREGLNTTVTVTLNRAQNIVYLKNDGKVEAALPWDMQKSSDTSDLMTHFKLGKISVSLKPSKSKNVFVVGFGSGATCGGALDIPSVKKLRVAEIEPTIFEIEHFFERSNGNPLRPSWLDTRRIVPFCGDARMSLNFSNEKYDAIISQPAEPWISGSSDLYTKEFWTLAKSKLTDDGSFCQWIQLYSIDPEYLAVLCRTFQSVFPNTYVFHFPRAGEIILLGSVRPIVPSDHPDYPNLVLLPDALKQNSNQLALRFQNDRFNTDNNLLTEYALPQKLYLSEKLIDENSKALGIGN